METALVEVGRHHDENGEPLVVADGKILGTVKKVTEFINQPLGGQPSNLEERIASLEVRMSTVEADIVTLQAEYGKAMRARS